MYVDKAVTDALEVFFTNATPPPKNPNSNNKKRQQQQPIPSVSSLLIQFTEGVLGK